MQKQPLPHSRQTPQSLDVLILAAGLGTRMKSKRAKVLHELGGSPLIAYVCRTAKSLNPEKIFVVVGHQAGEVMKAVDTEVGGLAEFATQQRQRGTADAVLSARAHLENRNSLLVILSGDVPLLKPETLERFIADHRSSAAACSILSVRLENPTGYGRIVRDSNDGFARIVEQRDASGEERKIREINSGIYCFDSQKLLAALDRVTPANDQGEFYLTDVAEILLKQGEKVNVLLHNDAREVSGINTRAELAEFENLLRRNTVRKLMLEVGVTFLDPSRAYISAGTAIGQDCVIYPDVAIEGDSVIGDGCEIHSGSRITNSRLGNNVLIKDHCVIVDSTVESNCAVGPFAHLRMNTVIAEGAVVGNFVEVKKSRLGRKSKSMHLTYLGDATIGENTNIGAGTVTCNYDGKYKHPTIIEDNVRIGSDTMLVAPVTVGRGSVTAAGSVVTEDVPPDTLVAGVPAVIKKKLKTEK
ncbi:MAG TPA: bifunctional UDP-N-acetylglucosamine diphosphorylase/glucosamine-1-phosphate N-acetyltransferase GlmU [Pyrinomonadaceae bacterium]|jgi:bifunctional UDP-N-acetylglucosamine pyrophosphorylase/glucosamine-1-phosphate N-acetyltransferase|nr:bifunctional UDP-N-acetylglucosamine diphosphorylase/glucosamine-1-phosphate N-acetyltransferase GlmU [Pyrinomonadaceae bacterium]